MRVDIITLFPELFGPFLETGMVGRAVKKGLLKPNLVDLRTFGEGTHRSVDDRPYGGGPGMVMMPGPIMGAVSSLGKMENCITLITSPAGELFSQTMAAELVRHDQIIIICGRYEGIDQRVVELTGGKEVSIGDYVLSGGELPAMVMIEVLVRLIPGVLGAEESAVEESFKEGLLEYPQYTRPRVYQGLEVPGVLLSGNHKEIWEWRRAKSLLLTMKRRPDLFQKYVLKPEDQKVLDKYSYERGVI